MVEFLSAFSYIIVWYVITSRLVDRVSAGVTTESSRKLTELLTNYDKRIRPYADEKPVEVKIQISILDLGPINEKDFTFRVDMYIRNWWSDPRLKLGIGNVTFNGNPNSEIWIPDLFIKNSKSVKMHSSTTETIRTIVSHDGSIFMSARISAICSCRMDLHTYPMDKQTCMMEMESYAFSDKDLELKWKEKPVEYDTDGLQVEGYAVTGIQSSQTMIRYIIGDNFPNLQISFEIERTFSYYVYRSYVPSTFLVIMTWGSFWLPVTTYPARTGLIVTNFLASAFILQGASSQITKVPYTTAIEIFLLVNIVFILASMLEFIAVIQVPANIFRNCCKTRKRKSGTNAVLLPITARSDHSKDLATSNNNGYDKHDYVETIKNEKHERADHFIDRAARICFPTSYLIYLITYFIYFLNFAQSEHNSV